MGQSAAEVRDTDDSLHANATERRRTYRLGLLSHSLCLLCVMFLSPQPAVAFLIQLLKSFVFSIPLHSAGASSSGGSSNNQTPPTSISSFSSTAYIPHAELLYHFPTDFQSSSSTARLGSLIGSNVSGVGEDVDLIEKGLELLRALRLP